MPKGGKREGAGRPPKVELPAVAKPKAASVLSLLGSTIEGVKLPTENQMWLGLLGAKDLRLRFDVIKYLTDRRDGKPVQPLVGDDQAPPIQINISAIPRKRERA